VVACHNDLDPRNTIYRSDGDALFPIALLDWDLAGPWKRVDDLAHVCWTYTGIHPTADPDLIRHRIHVCLDSYTWTGIEGEIVSAMLWWQDRCRRGIQDEAGDPKMQRWSPASMNAVRDDYDWTIQNLATLEPSRTAAEAEALVRQSRTIDPVRSGLATRQRSGLAGVERRALRFVSWGAPVSTDCGWLSPGRR